MLKEVLSQGPANQLANLSLFVGSLLGVSIAALSAAKGLEIIKRSLSATNHDACRAEITRHRSRNEELDCRAGETEKQLNFLREQNLEIVDHNEQLKRAVNSLSDELSKVKTSEQLLRKSNIALAKECERLKFENDTLAAVKMRGKRRKRKKVQ